MKGASLKEQRQALLAHIHASRDGYRRLLAGSKATPAAAAPTHVATMQDVAQVQHTRVPPASTLRSSDPAQGFPRSMTVRWIMKHPYLSASLVVGSIAVIGPKRIGRTLVNPHTVSLATAAGGLVIRNQAMLQKYGRMFSMGAGFLQAQRTRKRR